MTEGCWKIFCVSHSQLTLVFLKKLGGHNSYFGVHWYPYFGLLVTSLGFKTRVDSLVEVYVLHLPEIYLWCDTCWPLGGQHGSQADLFHIPVSKHWWGSKLRPIMLQTNALLTELCWFGSHSWLFGIMVITSDWESMGYVFKYRNFCFWKEGPSLISLILNSK